jgi:hypothetical protein
MTWFQVSLAAASPIVGASLWPAAAADLTDAQKAAMCQARKTCAIAPSLHNAGSSGAGILNVAELHFGIADKPDDAPEEGCIGADYETRDGGVEYWLLEDTEPPRLLLRLCNDGYGAAGVGEDEVTVAENRFTHRQNGGSASRWEETTTESLSPLRLVNVRSCSFHSLIPGSGMLADIDPIARIARSVTVPTDPAKAEDESDENGADVGCPDWPDKAAFTPTPAEGLIAGYDLPEHNLAGDATDLPDDGWTVGNCGFTMTTAGRNGFIVFGQPAAAADAAEITVLAIADNELVLQVYDPTAAAAAVAAAGKSWIHGPHIELWLAPDWDRETNPPADENLRQIGIDLAGRVYAAKGGKDALPEVTRWQAKDAAGRSVVVLRVTWAQNSYPFLAGLGLVYSQASGGKQVRLVANTGIVKNRPLYLPALRDPGRSLSDRTTACELRDDVLVTR